MKLLKLLLAGLGVGALAAVATRIGRDAALTPAPPGPTPRPVPPISGTTVKPFEVDLATGKVNLLPGTTYLAELDLGFLVDAVLSESALRTGLEKEGFIPIRLTRDRPADWPSDNDSADWYLVATASERKTRTVPPEVQRLWRLESV